MAAGSVLCLCSNAKGVAPQVVEAAWTTPTQPAEVAARWGRAEATCDTVVCACERLAVLRVVVPIVPLYVAGGDLASARTGAAADAATEDRAVAGATKVPWEPCEITTLAEGAVGESSAAGGGLTDRAYRGVATGNASDGTLGLVAIAPRPRTTVVGAFPLAVEDPVWGCQSIVPQRLLRAGIYKCMA